MGQRKIKLSFIAQSIILLFSLTILSGCLGSTQSDLKEKSSSVPGPSSQVSSQIVTTLPPAVVGNVLFAHNDEAPIIRNEFNEPIRLDKESEEAPLLFDGQNEE